jgi:predicted chitinase
MIISPPFLSLSDIPVYDGQCVKDVTPGGIVGSGAYPLSQAMGWHGGLHIHAPTNMEPVRAIADGIVIFRREGRTARYDNEDHSTGCVVIRHVTEIGAQGTAPVVVTYYSITQHLRQLDRALPPVGRAIYRKDRLGLAGTIHGESDRIHLEIIAGDADTLRLVGRTTGELAIGGDGRSDAVYGQAYVLVPAKTACYSAQPVGVTLPAAAGDSGNDDLIIGMRYEAGSATLTTYKLNGGIVGTAPRETDAEYNLYAEASTRHRRLSTADQLISSPSGLYELLRFGRNLGTDPLPANAAHWRKVAVPGQPGGVWINLNAVNTRKFSDADFPHWAGWKLIGDDVADDNSRCDSAMVNAMLTSPPQPGAATAPTPAQQAVDRMQNLCKSDVQEKLARTICKFPTEWAKDEVRKRWAWTRETGNPHMPYPLEDEIDFTEMADFAQKLCFWEDLPAEDKNRLTIKHWHFHPREFIKHLRMCGWLSRDELARVLAAAPVEGRTRAEGLRIPMNRVLRKYSISDSRLRQAHFLAQVGHETGWWLYRRELGEPNYWRTMYEIITPAEAGSDYDRAVQRARNLPSGVNPSTITRAAYMSTRPAQILTKAAGMDNGAANSANGGLTGDGERFRGRGFLQITGRRNYKGYGNYRGQDFTSSNTNADLLASNDANACDASGFYWTREKVNREADAGATPSQITRVGGAINRGSASRIPVHDMDRQNVFNSIWPRLSDAL